MTLNRRRIALVIAAVAVLGVTPFLVAATSGATRSHLAALACGDTVHSSVTLTGNVTGCSANGINIGANGLTINLNGHTISGSGTNIGVANTAFTGTTVENGTIANFARAVEMDKGPSTMRSLRVFGVSDSGLFTFGPATITKNIVYGAGQNGIYIGCCVADKSTITGNTVTGNSNDGILVTFSAANSIVTGNHALSNTNNGIQVNADGVTVSANIANGNSGTGLLIGSSDQAPTVKASGNIANFNTALGINLTAGDTDGGGNKATGNGSLHQCQNIVCS